MASGQTQLVAAIQEARKFIQDRKMFYKSNGINHYRPWIVVMMDDNLYLPDQDIDKLSTQILADVHLKKYVLMAIGICELVLQLP